MNKKQNKIWIWGIILLADILLSWVFFYICDMCLSDIFGPDIVVYENWFGDLDKSVEYRFGIGSVEILVTLIQAALFIYLEIMLYKKKKAFKVYTIVFVIVIHVLNLMFWILFYIDWNSWISIPEFLVPQYRVQEMLTNI